MESPEMVEARTLYEQFRDRTDRAPAEVAARLRDLETRIFQQHGLGLMDLTELINFTIRRNPLRRSDAYIIRHAQRVREALQELVDSL